MGAYTSARPVNNTDVAPAVPALVATYEQRARLFGERNPNFKHGRGRARRWRREVDTRRGLEHRAAILSGAVTFAGGDGRRYGWRELVHAPIGARPALVHGLRRRARVLMDLVTAHGPASGWGKAQPIEPSDRNAKWTPYEVPKAAEKCWRWWRAKRLELARLLLLLAYWWGRPIPPHRNAQEEPSTERQEETSSSCPTEGGTGYRDRAAHDWRAVAARLARHFGM